MLKGHVHPDFWGVARTLQRQLPKRGHGGAAVCVYHRGEKVVDMWGGTRDESGRPWEEGTVSMSYSTTKGVASTLVHMLVDRGLLEYDEPVARYWPEFAASGKEKVTLRQLMCHEGGLYDMRQLVDDASQMLDWDHMTAALAAATPVHPPGEAHGYHALTYGWLMGEIAQRVTQKPMSELLETELAGPLGLDGLFVGMPEHEMHRRARLIGASSDAGNRQIERLRRLGKAANRVLRAVRAPIDLQHAASALLPPGMTSIDMNSEAFISACIPAANGMFTARSLARLYAALAAGGTLDGVRLMSRDTLAAASRIQNKGIGRVVPLPMHWRLGYHRVFAPGCKTTRAFGHFGAGGSGAWADPERNLSVALVLNSGLGTPFGDSRVALISRAAIRAADARH